MQNALYKNITIFCICYHIKIIKLVTFLAISQGRRKQFWSGEAGAVGKAHSTLGGSGSMPPRKILKIYIALDWFWGNLGGILIFKYCWLKAAPASPTPTTLVSQEQKVGRLWLPQPPHSYGPVSWVL